MATVTLRANLLSSTFPMVTELWGRSVINAQYDENASESTLLKSVDKGVPQAFYLQNAMPTAQGYQAIGYEDELPAMPPGDHTDFDQAYPIQNASLNKFLFVPANGMNYIFDRTVGEWASVSPIGGGTVTNKMVTTAFVQGQSYIFYSGYGCFIYNETTKLLDPVVLDGLSIPDVLGVTSANGYMIAFTTTGVAWSSLVDPTDFIPSLVTGAGGGSVNETQGAIIVCLPIEGGFIVYCEKNTVGARYTGNNNFPYNFSELPGSAGVVSPEYVSWQSNIATHFVWSTAGLMQVDLTQSQNIFPEITDFLAGRIWEDFDEDTLTWIQYYTSANLIVKLNVVSSRYIVISYGLQGASNLTFAIIFDIALGRWGKVKLEHRDCFQWNNPNFYGILEYKDLVGAYNDLIPNTYYDLWFNNLVPDIPKRTLGFLKEDGSVVTVNFDLSEATANGVLLLGKFQFIRDRFIEHEITDVETIDTLRDFDFYVVPSLDGKSLDTPVPPMLLNKWPKSRNYAGVVPGINYSLLFTGSFNLTSVITNFTLGGYSSYVEWNQGVPQS